MSVLPDIKMHHRRAVGLMFGSYNPPHEGHRQTALRAKEMFKLDEVWFLPVPQSPLKKGTLQASFNQKVQMCRLLIGKREDGLKVSELCGDFETDILGSGLSIKKLLNDLPKKNQGTDFFIVSGEDFANRMEKVAAFFKAASSMAGQAEALFGFHILSRLVTYLADMDKALSDYPVYAVPRTPCVSSSRIREALQNRQPAEGLPPQIADYIQKNKLY